MVAMTQPSTMAPLHRWRPLLAATWVEVKRKEARVPASAPTLDTEPSQVTAARDSSDPSWDLGQTSYHRLGSCCSVT